MKTVIVNNKHGKYILADHAGYNTLTRDIQIYLYIVCIL